MGSNVAVFAVPTDVLLKGQVLWNITVLRLLNSCRRLESLEVMYCLHVQDHAVTLSGLLDPEDNGGTTLQNVCNNTA
jgi:hypothetical protein